MAKSNQITLAEALIRGLKGRCPKCREGKLFKSFLKVDDFCALCGQELFHHKADDMPAYIVILIVGHIIVPSFMWVTANYQLPDWLHLSIWIPLTVIMSLSLIQPVKGAVVAFQWHKRMHGFADDGN